MNAAPGPYEVVIVEDEPGRDGSKWVMIRNEGGAIATVYPAKNAEATARLIAASWELLQCCKLARTIAQDEIEKLKERDGRGDVWHHQILSEATARFLSFSEAIAKSEGAGLAAIYQPSPVERSVFDEAEVTGEAK